MSKDEPRTDDVAALKRRVAELRKELSRLGPLMRGSLVVIGTRNKQPYFSVNIKRKTHLLYLGRPLLEEAVQKLADRQVLSCPQCGGTLHVERHQRLRHVFSVFGKVPFVRSYGFCSRCRQRFYPADRALGLQERAPASPRVQEICALMVLESPAGQAEANIRRLTGLDLGQASMHREARRQGERALKLRDADVALTNTLEGVCELARRSQAPRGDFTLLDRGPRPVWANPAGTSMGPADALLAETA